MNYYVGDLIVTKLAARIWNEEIQEAIGSLRRCDTAIVLDAKSRQEYLKIFSSRNIEGWVLKNLVLKVKTSNSKY